MSTSRLTQPLLVPVVISIHSIAANPSSAFIQLLQRQVADNTWGCCREWKGTIYSKFDCTDIALSGSGLVEGAL